MRRIRKAKDKGSAMIVALVVCVVVMTFALSLLLVSYSLFASTNKEITENECRELAISITKELRNELMNANYNSYDEQALALGNENSLWFFVRNNIWQGTVWPYYCEGVTGHSETFANKYFTINLMDNDKYSSMADKVLITMYWEIDSEEPELETDKSLVILHVKVDVIKGDASYYSMNVPYQLTVSKYDVYSDMSETVTIEDDNINPNKCSIVKNEKWIWTLN